MDIDLLSKMVAELVRERHEVGLPGLGTFVSEFVPASFSDRGYTINPPYKRVTFMPGTVTDNSLVELYAASNGLDNDQALAVLQHFLEDTRKVLMDRKTVVFPGLGRLRATRQNNIFFITDETLDIYPDGFGLEPVSLKNHEESTIEVHHVVESLAGILVDSDTEPAAESAAESASGQPQEQPDEIIELADEPAAAELDPSETRATLGIVRGGTTSEASGGAERSEAVSERSGRAARRAAKAARKAEKQAAREQRAAEKAAAKAAKAEARAARKAARADAKAQRRAARAERRAKRKPINKWVWLAPLLLIALLAFAAAAFLILVQVAPDFVDTLLYTPDELRIINW